ncbi:MAG: spore cortex-lytic enzyme [Peptostreptococcales bacterium]|jgi:N-acetylmuramoyl-L-alanine amidase
MKKTTFIIFLCITLILLSFVISPHYFMDNVFAADIMHWGSTGERVRQAQQKLINWGYLKGSADGIFGQMTHDAVVAFQRRHGLKADGIIGSQTLSALGMSTKSSGSSGSGSNIARQDEKILLAKAITGEARGEPYIGQVAVGAVILNRTRNPSFPNTIAGVIYQPGAFTAVDDGQINLQATKDSIRAAEDALNGWDPTGGCIYYWNPATATSKWIWSRSIVKVIGKHNFGV